MLSKFPKLFPHNSHKPILEQSTKLGVWMKEMWLNSQFMVTCALKYVGIEIDNSGTM